MNYIETVEQQNEQLKELVAKYRPEWTKVTSDTGAVSYVYRNSFCVFAKVWCCSYRDDSQWDAQVAGGLEKTLKTKDSFDSLEEAQDFVEDLLDKPND